MNNKPYQWKIANTKYIDEYWIAYNDGMHTHYFQQSLSGKHIYTIGYAKFCLIQYQALLSPEYTMWVEPAYRRIS